MPEMPDYESLRLVFNRAFDWHPAVIVRCAAPSDVVRSLDFARAKSLPLALRGRRCDSRAQKSFCR
jgi:hypothetical protein